MPKPEKTRVDPRRAYLNPKFCTEIRSHNMEKLCEEFKINKGTMEQWEEHTNKADIYDIRLHQIAERINFPKNRMFR